ncbi:unnamed protein product [Eruca vesicaria subsp. sativa]|uniref:Uncharacterized protein n=1 Tax=Eruca vesicaria subsp. sativa TaxID=29727 RepID=A0ABC8K0J7_ERUVS|nr:unnamed protein product [Eruca vesicaria subsp. sativa]
MGGSTSKQDKPNMRSVKKETSTERSRGRRHMRRETDVREKEMFDKLREAESEWVKETKKLREKVKRLRKKVEEKEEAKTTTTEEREYWKWVVKEMCVEKAVRDEAIEKWNQLYLAIKNELDHLIIHTTSFFSGKAMMQRQLEGKDETEKVKTVEKLRNEVRVKEDTIETLKEKIALMDR